MSLSDDGTYFSENEAIAISLYNKALQKIEAGNEDLARLDLKRAISLYPEFYTAIILLGVCIFCNGDRIGALRIFNSVKDENYRVESMAYLDKLAQMTDRYVNKKNMRKPVVDKIDAELKIREASVLAGKVIVDAKKDIVDAEKVIVERTIHKDLQHKEQSLQFEKVTLNVPERENNPQNAPKKIEVKVNSKIQKTLMIASVLVLLFVVVLLIVISDLSSKNSEYKRIIGDTHGDGTSITVNGNNSKNLEKELSDLKVKIAVIEPERDQYKLMADFNSAQVQYSSNNYKNVVDIVSAMDRSKLNEEQKGILQTIYDDSLNRFSLESLYKMYDYRKNENYSELIKVALPVYEKNPGFSRAPEIIFYMALAYEKTVSLENARNYYKILIEQYPDSEQTRLAKSMLINK